MYRILLLVLSLLVPLAARAASPSDSFWNPFRDAGESIADDVRDLLETVRAEIEAIAGRTVSRFTIPDPTRIGFRPLSAYLPSFLGRKSQSGIGKPTPPSPAPGDQSQHDPPPWAADCSCRRGDPCPDDPSKRCEDCRTMTRGPSTIKTREECLAGSHVESFDVD